MVVDASAIASLILPDESDPPVADRIAGAGALHAPWLLWAELRNILVVAERRGRLEPGQGDRLAADLDDLGVVLDTGADGAAVMGLARRHSLSVYDSLYLALALRWGMPLITLDRRLATAAQAEGVEG
ncbi:PIN domain-containing protein [Rhodobacteraceae bacterium CCMM004]|nr:PIN domain-containing protein [Rhodobacteraceae bacterium CCMM004]